MDTIFATYNTTSLIILSVTALLWGGSHIFLAMGLKELDFSSRILGFIGFVSLFIVAGLKGGLIAIPIIIVFSFFGGWEAKKIKNKVREK